MEKQHLRTCGVLLALLVMFASVPCPAVVRQYVEDFTTTTYRDTANTTARWDTLAGEIGLFPFELTTVGSAPGVLGSNDIALDGDLAFLTDSIGALFVIDISDPTNPASLAMHMTGGASNGVAVAGNTVYVGAGGTLQVIDVADPEAPASVGSCSLPGGGRDVVTAGNLAFVAAGSGGLALVDVSDPANPFVLAAVDTVGEAWGVAVAGDLAYVAADAAGLLLIDVTDPLAPSLVGVCDTPGSARGVAVACDVCYVADGAAGLQMIDVGDPANPLIVGAQAVDGLASDIVIDGDRAYVASGTAGLCVVDITDPTGPELLLSQATAGQAFGLALAGEHAFIAAGFGGLQVIDVRDFLTRPDAAGGCGSGGNPRGIAIDGDLVCFTHSYSSQLSVADISSPREPVILGTAVPVNSPYDIAVAGDLAYVAAWISGLQVFDLSDPTNPTAVGLCDTLGNPRAVVVDGDYAFIAGSPGFYVADVSDPAAPARIGWCDTPGYAIGVAATGDLAFVADGTAGLSIIDVSDPANPSVVGTCDTPGYAEMVAVSGNYAFVADEGSGYLRVIDVGDPTAPAIVAEVYVTGHVTDVAITGDLAYVACRSIAGYSGAIYPVDISDPTDPQRLLGGFIDGHAGAIAIAGDFAYVAASYSGLHVAWISQAEFLIDANLGQSLPFENAEHEVAFARLTFSQVDSIRWEVSLNGGENWQYLRPDYGWVKPPHRGTDLMWRTAHYYRGEGRNPACTDLAIEWAYEIPTVEAIVDLPDDQGRQVSLTWTRSGYDYIGSSDPITFYAVFRRIDDLRGHPETTGRQDDGRELESPRGVPEDPTRYPPGDWHYVLSVPARCDNEYSVMAPTLVDWDVETGTGYSVFFVRAATDDPSVFFDSPPDSGFSMDNLAPAPPSGFTLDYGPDGNHLAWEPNEEEDLDHYRVYRSTDPDFVPSPESLAHATTDTEWIDDDPMAGQYHYLITAVDFAGNESAPSPPETVTDVDGPTAPRAFALYQNVPNPFSPTTSIRYDVPAQGGHVTIRLFDVAGRLVRTLVDGPEMPGRKEVRWDGRDERGASVASGVYYCRLEAAGFETTRKMTLLR